MRRTAGFTLVELMIVVAIIAILVVVAAANMQNGRKGANEASTIAFFKQAVICNQQYRTRFGRFPASFDALASTSITESTTTMKPLMTCFLLIRRPVLRIHLADRERDQRQMGHALFAHQSSRCWWTPFRGHRWPING